MKVSNPEGAVRVLRATVAKMAKDYKALERKLARVTAIKDREFDARMGVEMELERASADRDALTAAANDAIQAMAGGLTPPGTVRELSEALLHFVRGTMRTIEQNNVEGAELREKLKAAESDVSSRMLTLAEDNAIVEALAESRLGDMNVVEAVAKAIRAEALEPIVVSYSTPHGEHSDEIRSPGLADTIRRYEDAVVRNLAPHPMRYAHEYGA